MKYILTTLLALMLYTAHGQDFPPPPQTYGNGAQFLFSYTIGDIPDPIDYRDSQVNADSSLVDYPNIKRIQYSEFSFGEAQRLSAAQGGPTIRDANGNGIIDQGPHLTETVSYFRDTTTDEVIAGFYSLKDANQPRKSRSLVNQSRVVIMAPDGVEGYVWGNIPVTGDASNLRFDVYQYSSTSIGIRVRGLRGRTVSGLNSLATRLSGSQGFDIYSSISGQSNPRLSLNVSSSGGGVGYSADTSAPFDNHPNLFFKNRALQPDSFLFIERMLWAANKQQEIADVLPRFASVYNAVDTYYDTSIGTGAIYDETSGDIRINSWIYGVRPRIHEGAHALHVRMLENGYDNAEVLAMWNMLPENRRGVNTNIRYGNETNSYWRTNEREFFAELLTTYIYREAQRIGIDIQEYRGPGVTLLNPISQVDSNFYNTYAVPYFDALFSGTFFDFSCN